MIIFAIACATESGPQIVATEPVLATQIVTGPCAGTGVTIDLVSDTGDSIDFPSDCVAGSSQALKIELKYPGGFMVASDAPFHIDGQSADDQNRCDISPLGPYCLGIYYEAPPDPTATENMLLISTKPGQHFSVNKIDI